VALGEALALPTELPEESEIPAETTDAGADRPAIYRFAELIRDVFDCRAVQVGLVDARTNRYTPAVMAGIAPEEARQYRRFFGEHRLDEYLTAEQRSDLQAGRSIVVDAARNTHMRRGLGALSVTSVLAAPLLHGAEVIGLMGLSYAEEEPPFGPETQSLVEASARLAAIILEQERLVREREEARVAVLAMQESGKQMDAFLGMATHELKAPLTPILLALQAAQRRLQYVVRPESSVPSALVEQLEGIGVQLARLEARVWQLDRLVNDLLDITRVQAGKLQMHPDLVDLRRITQQVVDEQREVASSRTIRLHPPPADQQALALVDADRIGQVITNYLTNALKYSPADRPVEVGVDIEDASARVWVRDQGPGLPAEEQERVWQRYYRVPGIEVQSGTGVGLGLGLSISREIIAHHDGAVGVESTPGQGSTFWFTVPLAKTTERCSE
jgi:signal transduction histidine kinase